MVTLKGNALITALFIMTIVAISATLLAVRVHVGIRHTELFEQALKASDYAQSACVLAAGFMETNKPEMYTEFSWTEPAKGYEIKSKMFETKSLFNLNDRNKQTDFSKLLLQLDPNLGVALSNEITQDLLKFQEPLQTITQLRLVPSISPEFYEKLQSHVIALPDPPTEKQIYFIVLTDIKTKNLSFHFTSLLKRFEIADSPHAVCLWTRQTGL